MMHPKVISSLWLSGGLALFLVFICVGQATARTCIQPTAGVGVVAGDRSGVRSVGICCLR
jgi:hypothetical protein